MTTPAMTSATAAAAHSDLLTVDIQAPIAILTLNRPHKRNALSLRVVLALKTAFETLPDTVRVVVLAGTGTHFCAGLDLSELSDTTTAEGIRHSFHWYESFSKIQFGRFPVVCAMQGAVVGGGLELALSAHARIAAPETKIGLPEIHLGLLPGAGGTQALPRLIGIEKAYAMMLHGHPLLAEEARECGLIDAISHTNLIEETLALAHALLKLEVLPLKPAERQIPPAQAALIPAYRKAIPFDKGAKLASAQAILDCLERAVELPFAQGLQFEATKFHELLDSYASKALRYGFFASKTAASLPAPQIEAIGRRLMAALSQEAEKLLTEGIARNQADIDAIMVKTHGFAAEAGGPLFWLQQHQGAEND